jgi:hypothetical protein
MGFFTQIIIISVASIFGMRLYSKKLRAKNKDWNAFMFMILMAVMYGWGILVYTNIIPIANLVNWLPWVDVEDGRDWMWNSFQLLGYDSGIIHQEGMNWIAVLIFMSYPAVCLFNASAGMQLFGRKTYEEGFMWALSPVKKPKGYKKQNKK